MTIEGGNVRSMMPSLLRDVLIYVFGGVGRATSVLEDSPGFREWQSAQTLLPGTFCTRSWSVFSLRACWRLLRGPFMAVGNKREAVVEYTQ